MEYENDCSLLRPFDLEAAKRGEKICTSYGNNAIFIGVKSYGRIVFEDHSQLYDYLEGNLKMAPLAWVEGRPVYKGDVLYHKSSNPSQAVRISGLNMRDNGKGLEGIVIEKGNLYTPVNELTWASFYCWTWQKRIAKREGWVNIYSPTTGTIKNTSHVYSTKEQADNMATINRIACCRIEWEE